MKWSNSTFVQVNLSAEISATTTVYVEDNYDIQLT